MQTRLQDFRKAAGYKSAKAFAEANGINVRTYTNYEQGSRAMDVEMLWKLADIFDCSIDELVGRAPKAHAKTEEERRLLDAFRDCSDNDRSVVSAVAAAISR